MDSQGVTAGRADSSFFVTEDNKENKDSVFVVTSASVCSCRFPYPRHSRNPRFHNFQTSRVRDPKILRSTPVNGEK
jgi:hypothetical protein